jgi:glucokinase
MIYKNAVKYVICADIGGSHITAAIINLEERCIVDDTFTRLEVNSKGTRTDIMNTWIRALKKANEASGSSAQHVALAMPGPFDYIKGISYITGLNKYEAIFGLNIKQLFAEGLDIDAHHIRFRNDAEATIAGEVLAGAGQYFDNVMGLTLGTGFGSAQFTNNRSRDLDLGSQPFKDTIADDYMSTRWFLKTYFERTGISLTDGVKELASIADTNRTARDLFREFAENMAAFLAGPIKQNQPEILLLCGNIAKSSPYFLTHLKNNLSVDIQLATLGERSALIGASDLFQSQLV